MTAAGPIIYVEDDVDDQQLLKEVFRSLQISNELQFFDNGKKVLEYLRATTDQPF